MFRVDIAGRLGPVTSDDNFNFLFIIRQPFGNAVDPTRQTRETPFNLSVIVRLGNGAMAIVKRHR